MKEILLKICTACILAAAFVVSVQTVSAASLNLSSEGGTRSVKEFLTVNVVVDPEGENVNAVTGKISYDKSRLMLKSIAVGESAVSFWVLPPTDVNGEISFEGVILSSGSNTAIPKEIMRLVFETRSVGQANMQFLEGSVLRDDGRATNILDTFKNASVLIKSPASGMPVVAESAPKATIALLEEEYPVSSDYRLAILEYPTRVLPNERVALNGVAGSNDEISINMAIARPNSVGERLLRIFKNDPGALTASVKTDEEGRFSHTFNESLVAGAYTAWAEKELGSEGGDKVKSEPVSIEIKYGMFYRIWIWLINTLLLITPITLLGIIVFIVFSRGRREILSAENFIHDRRRDKHGR